MRRTLVFCCLAATAFLLTDVSSAQHGYRGWHSSTQPGFNPLSPLPTVGNGVASSPRPRYRVLDRLPPAPAMQPRTLNQLVYSPSALPANHLFSSGPPRLTTGPVITPTLPQPIPQPYQVPAQVGPGWKGKPARVPSSGKSVGRNLMHRCATSNCCAPTWCASLGGLIMTRSRDDNLWLSYDQASIASRVLTSNHADFNYGGGVQAGLRRYINGGGNSIEFVYWGIYPSQEEANVLGADTVGGLDTILHFDGLSYDPGTGPLDVGGGFYFNAERHRVQREYQIHNAELNLLGHNFATPCCGLTLGWTAGVRYLRLDEDFLYSTDPNDTVFDGSPEELHYGIDVANNLIGFQLGGRADYCFWDHFNTFVDTKVGLFGNHITHQSAIFGSNGFAFVSDPASPYFNQDVNISSSKDDFAMLADLRLGLDVQVHPCWNVGIGYRVLGITGVALATHQVPADFIGALPSLQAVDTNCGLLLHGGFLNVEYCH